MTDDAAIVQGTSTTMKTLADGTLRVAFDVSPQYAQLAFALFGAPGTPVAIARLTQESSQSMARGETIERHKGGAVAKLAGQLCSDPQFREWLGILYSPAPQSAEDAAEIVRNGCGIASRAELDHNPEAEQIFHDAFRKPFVAWRERI